MHSIHLSSKADEFAFLWKDTSHWAQMEGKNTVSASFKIQGVLARLFVTGRTKENKIYRSWQRDHAIITA